MKAPFNETIVSVYYVPFLNPPNTTCKNCYSFHFPSSFPRIVRQQTSSFCPFGFKFIQRQPGKFCVQTIRSLCYNLSDYAFVQELKQDDLFHFAPAFGGAHSSPRKLRFAACEFVGHLFAFRSVQSMLAVPHATVRSKAASM